jgi:L-ascorbate metabolism protein UlaG (beta-lactamase superfamily)
MLLRLFLPLAVGVFAIATGAFAQDKARHYSQCQAIAQAVPGTMFARFEVSTGSDVPVLKAALADHTVRLTFIGHSTFLIETPEGVTIATDYNGYVRPPVTPQVVTMNRAHTTHYTLTPDPGIDTVLHGWSDDPSRKAEHSVVVKDTFIRNVTSDIRGGGGLQADGNSIFIFEVAGLCIGHLGHLHQELSEGQYAEIGRLDVVMVPVDGGLTMGVASMSRVVSRLRSSLILPMHRPGPSLVNFLAMMGPEFEVSMGTSDTVEVSLNTLPKKPLILVVPGMQ